jgi:AAA family ATP:ADP antiporter
VNRLTRLQVARAAAAIFAAVLVAFWLAIHFGGAALGAKRPFVWAVYILVEIYATVMVGIFWTYANDVVSSDEADRLYGLVGLGGILGGIAGGAFVDALAKPLGAINLLLVCAALVIASGAVATVCERVLHPRPRRASHEPEGGFSAALEGARDVSRSGYLRLLVGIVIAYEFTATLTDFVINVIFERSFSSEGELAKMYGRLGWVASATAVVSQLFLVPRLLPRKRVALLVPPLAMAAAALGTGLFPVVALAFVLGASDRGLNYSLHQSVKETLYVPLSDSEKYKAKAFIDMFVDRAAKALAALVLIGVIARAGLSVRVSIVASLVAVGLWIYAARALGKKVGSPAVTPPMPRASVPPPGGHPAASHAG